MIIMIEYTPGPYPFFHESIGLMTKEEFFVRLQYDLSKGHQLHIKPAKADSLMRSCNQVEIINRSSTNG